MGGWRFPEIGHDEGVKRLIVKENGVCYLYKNDPLTPDELKSYEEIIMSTLKSETENMLKKYKNSSTN
ncbi:MAG: hypothetical protein A7316_04435 [Candidatus Altiarchaeales archaeon WOR_SM1_86-2]|nr:MAG: hypothetical protein A7316_04435 [Candidatus Altiarchaeales archaeon WOR_SM1_86-2]